MNKFRYATRLNPFGKNNNRIALLAPDLVLLVVENQRSFLTIHVRQLPFSSFILRAQQEVNDSREHTYYNIGSRPEELVQVTDGDLLHINYTLFLLALRRANVRHTWHQGLSNYFTSYVREEVMSSTYVHQLKLVTLSILHRGWSPRTHMKAIADEYERSGFARATASLYALLWISGEAKCVVQDLMKTNEPYVLDLEALLEETDTVVVESNLSSLAKHYAYKKLTFIANSQRFSPDDFSSELLNRSRQAYLHCRPFLGRQHATNYARATISTYTLRILQHFIEDENSRLLETEDGGYDNRFSLLDESHSDGTTEDGIIERIDFLRDAGLFY